MTHDNCYLPRIADWHKGGIVSTQILAVLLHKELCVLTHRFASFFAVGWVGQLAIRGFYGALIVGLSRLICMSAVLA